MNKTTIISLLILALNSVSLYAATSDEIEKYQKESRAGVLALSSQDYDKAFNHLLTASKLGNKEAQYSLALLYMDGKGTVQDYGQAYIWLNVAAEVNEKKWQGLRDKIHNALSAPQLASLKPFVEDYIKQYGQKAQDITCTRRSQAVSRLHKRMECSKNLKLGSTHHT